MSSKLQMSKIVIICLYLKKIYELRSEALLTQIFEKLSAAIFCLQWFIFGGINGGNCLLPPKIARAANGMHNQKSSKGLHVAHALLTTATAFKIHLNYIKNLGNIFNK